MSWLSVFVRWSDEFCHTKFSRYLFSFLFTAACHHRSESESTLQSAYSVTPSTHLSLPRHLSLRERFAHAISFTAACLRLVEKCWQFVIWTVCCPQCEMRIEPRWPMVCVLPSSLRSAPLRLKQNYTICSEDLSFDTVTSRYHGINDTPTFLLNVDVYVLQHAPY